MDDPDEDETARIEQLNAHKRYNMKSLGRLVDSNRLTGVARPESLDTPSRGAKARESAPSPGPTLPRRGAPAPPHGEEVDDGVDRSDMGGHVTRTGLSTRLEEPAAPQSGAGASATHPLARQMLDGEIAQGGRISDPRDVSGIVLDLAKNVPASVAVSVVRIDEHIEIVGDTIDPSIDPSIFSDAFSGVFQNVRPAADILEQGPLGAILDVVVSGEDMDLVLRPLGDRYYLMLLEDRRRREADLTVTRYRMATVAPGLKAILAQLDGDA